MLGSGSWGKYRTIGTISKGKRTSYKGAYGLPPSSFVNKDDPNYKPNYGTKYTERQLAIIAGELPLESLRLNDLQIIIRKAEGIGDIDTADKVQEMYNELKYKDRYKPTVSYEDALVILDQLDND